MDVDNFFSDDDLDDTTVFALEHHAIASTQRRSKPAPAALPSSQAARRQPYKANGLSKPAGSKNLPYRPPSSRLPQKQHTAPPPSAPAPPSSDYGLDDEDVIDLDEQSVVTQPPSANINAQLPTDTTHDRWATKYLIDTETRAAFAAADAEMDSNNTYSRWPAPRQQGASQIALSSADFVALRARVEELEAEQRRLRDSEQTARNAANSKSGEVAILRSNLQKTTKKFEETIASMSRLHTQETARHKAEIEAGKKEREQMQTDNRFWQHEAAQEAERAKRVLGPVNLRATSNRETPKKNRKFGFGDGFDGDEVRLVSPSRSKDKSREHTPKVGAKRKRPVQDSPMALDLSHSTRPARFESSDHVGASTTSLVHRSSAAEKDVQFEYLHMILSRRPDDHMERSVELLTRYSFPSTPNKSVSAILMDGLLRCSVSTEIGTPAMKTARVLLGIWRECIQARYFAPFSLILDLLQCALHSELPSVRSQLIEEALPLCTRTIDVIALPTAKLATIHGFAETFDLEAFDRLKGEVCVYDVYEFFRGLCEAASLSPGRIAVFWNTCDWNDLMTMLHKAQPIRGISTVLQILRTSALENSFGPVHDDPEQRVAQENSMIDKLTTLMFEALELPPDEPPYTEAELMELRIEILETFREMCLSSHNSILLAQHHFFTARLVRFIHLHTSKLYTARPSVGLPRADIEISVHDLVAKTINMSIRILYHIMRVHDKAINLKEKLDVTVGGWHKFYISMSRIAFSDGLVFEAGLEDEVREAAHAILDTVLAPVEGDAIREALETPRGTKGTSTERDTRIPTTQPHNGDSMVVDAG